MIDRKFIIFDIETTDVHANVNLPQIVEIAAVKCTADLSVIDEFHEVIRPNRLEEFTQFSESLTGLTPQELADAPAWKEVWKSWAKFTEWKHCRLFSWGGTDIAILRDEYKRISLGYPHNPMPICVASMVYMWGSLRGWKPKGLGLASVCKEFGIVIKGHHRAQADVQMTLAVLKHILQPDEEDAEVQIYAV